MTAAPILEPVASFRPLDPRIVLLWRIGTAFRVVLWTALLLLVAEIVPAGVLLWPVGVAVVLGGVLSAVFVAPARYRAWEFRVGSADVRLRRGVLWRTESVVPHVRIQHVDTTHGPLERWRGLASVVVFTAGSVGGSLTIPGLALDEAESLRDQLAALSGTDDAV